MGMRVRLRGAEKLRAVASALGDPDRALNKAAMIGAEESLNLISEGFKSGTDPYGTPWDAPNDLQITGRLRSYAKSESNPRGWKVHATDQKAAWHHNPQPRPQWGGKALPTRLQIPTQDRGLPKQWAERLRDAIEEAISGMYRRLMR